MILKAERCTAAAAPAPSTSENEPTTSDPGAGTGSPTVPEPSTDEDAVALQDLRRQDLARVTPADQWVAQLASKYDGIVDPLQTAADGQHVFTDKDILAEHQALRSGPNAGAEVVLLLSTDYGKRQLVNGRALWVTFAVGSFGSAADVASWCTGRFPGLTGKALTNACTARHLEPAHG